MQTITITFCDCAENHTGMQQIGKLASEGFNLADLKSSKAKFEEKGCTCELVDLMQLLPKGFEFSDHMDASVLIVRNGVNTLLKESKRGVIPWNADMMYAEQQKLKVDKKAKMYGRVVNKKARHNLCFGTKSQKPDYENGQGRIVSFANVPITNALRSMLVAFVGPKANGLLAEGNYYYDIKKCYIGWHGDSERKKVIGVRLGATFPLHFQWYMRSGTISERLSLTLKHGDIYMMSQKATGNDWKKRNRPTLRHAAGTKII